MDKINKILNSCKFNNQLKRLNVILKKITINVKIFSYILLLYIKS